MANFITSLQRAITVKPEVKANLIRISFGHRDPVVAAEFANALARALISRQAELWSRPGAVNFFEVQRQKFEEDVRKAYAEFTSFIASTATYSISDQRELLLRRVSEVSTALATTRGNIADREGQKTALADQLKRLKPVAASPFVSNLVDELGSSRKNGASPQGKESNISGNPPLLLVRVYQDGLANLLKINSELAGLQSLGQEQEKDLKQIDEELSKLAAKEAQFNRLKKAVEIASTNADLYSKRMIEEQINADLVKAKMSGLRLIQSAMVPTKPAFPSFAILGPGALVVGFMAAIGAALLLDRRGSGVRPSSVGTRAQDLGAYRADTTLHQPRSRFTSAEEDRFSRVSHDT